MQCLNIEANNTAHKLLTELKEMEVKLQAATVAVVCLAQKNKIEPSTSA